MLVLGCDPGTATTGYGIVSLEGNRFIHHAHGAISTLPSLELPQRLHIIFQELTNLINKFQPDTLVVESLFFNRNIRTAMSVAQARGIILLLTAIHKLPFYEYTPPQIKLSVTGYGKADKQQIQYMIKTLLNLENLPKPDDAADALGVAVCHLNQAKL